MALELFKWSRTAASNATADSNVNWAEGQAPSSVNDSARSMMASVAGYRDDIAGAIATGGTSTAYTVTSYEVFDSLANMSGHVIAFTPHTTNGATVTLNVDGLGAKPLRSAPSVELPAGVLIQGTPYTALYNNSDAVWYLHNFFVNPYSIPIGASVDFWGSTAPNSSFVLAYGQAVSRTTYSTLFSLFSTTYGSGDGSTTFNIPDCRGRVIAGKDDMGGSAASRITTATIAAGGATLGAAGGAETLTLTAAQIPSITSSGTNSITVYPGGNSGISIPYTDGTWFNAGAQIGTSWQVSARSGGSTILPVTSFSNNNSISVTSNNTSGSAHGNVQPTIICNKLLRII